MKTENGLEKYLKDQLEFTLKTEPVKRTDEVSVHPTAMVDKKAQLGKGVSIGAYSIVGPNVALHDNVTVGSHSVIDSHTTVGENTKISNFSSIGVPPQDISFKGEPTELHVGRDNNIREYANFCIGTEHGGGKTVVGDGSLFMVNTHVAHDCFTGNHCIFANGVSLAGHVTVGDFAILGGHIAVHQFCRVGMRAMIGGGAMVVRDVPPYCMAQGDRAKVFGLNSVGLRRAGYSKDDMQAIKKMYRLLYRDGLTYNDAIAAIESEVPESEHRRIFIDFLRGSQRGVCR